MAHHGGPRRSLLLDDPNLLFVNAGMVPFKPYFLGQETPPYPRAVSVQKCVRTPDIEDVGKTTRHGTFFQMCGNFSFGDYFKEGAIELAWDLVTKPSADGGWGLARSRLYPSVYTRTTRRSSSGSKVTGLPDERIIRLGKKENYWSMGVPGPGGPCSEILFDRGPAYGPDGDIGSAEDRYLEIWNLVFMQDELRRCAARRTSTSSARCRRRTSTPAWAWSGSRSCFRARTTCTRSTRCTRSSSSAERAQRADATAPTTRTTSGCRVVADHVRSAMMLIGDGVTPGNEGRGYVLRRLLRRAVRSMRLLGVEDRVLPELFPVSRDRMSATYPELARDWERISTVAYAEEDAFRQTLQAGHADLRPRGRRAQAGGGAASCPATRRSRCTTPTASRST